MNDISIIVKYLLLLFIVVITIFLYSKKRKLRYLFLIFLQTFSIVFMYLSDFNHFTIDSEMYELMYIFTVIFPLVLYFDYLIQEKNYNIHKKKNKYHSYDTNNIKLRINDDIKLYSPFRISLLEKKNKNKLKKYLKEIDMPIEETSIVETIKNYRNLRIFYPKNPFILYNEGMLHYKNKEYQEAFSLLLRSIVIVKRKKFKKSKHIISKSYCMCGNCFFKTSMITEAIFCYEKAIKFNSNNIQAKENLVFAYLMHNKPEKALDYYKYNLQKTNKSFLYSLHLFIGKYYEKEEHLEKALISYELAGKIKNSQEIDLLTANLLYRLKKYEEASEKYKKILKLNSKKENAIYGLALCLAKMEKYDLAYKYFSKITGYKESIYNISYIHYKNKEYIKCINILEKHVYTTENNIKLLKLLSNAYFKTGRYVESYEILLKCKSKFPKDSSVIYNLGVVNYFMKNYNEANIYFHKAYSMLNNDIDLIIYLLKTNIKTENYIDANKILKKEISKLYNTDKGKQFLKRYINNNKIATQKYLEKITQKNYTLK